MSDLDDDLFGSSDDGGGDTDDLIAEAKSTKKMKPIATKKKKVGKKKIIKKKIIKKKKTNTRKIPDADHDSDDDDDDGLFDDSDDEEKQTKSKSSSTKKPMSRREKMEALQKKKRAAEGGGGGNDGKEKSRKKKDNGEEDDAGSVDSADIALTKEDHDFIDSEDDDEDARRELYAEQHFDEERDLDDFVDHSSDRRKIKMGGSRGGGSGKARRRGPDAVSDDEGADTQNPIMQAVHKMKKKKREQRKAGEVEEEVKNLIDEMDNAADEDLEAFKARRPATRKLALLPQVVDSLVKKDTMRVMLDCDVLATLKRWIQPLPNGKLGNVTIRSRVLETVATMNGSDGISSYDLKRSEFGKAVMGLYMHPQETPTLKRLLKKLIEQWSRPIFSKSGNMRDLEQAHATRNSQMSYVNQSQQVQQSPSKRLGGQNQQDLNSLISSGKRKRDEGGVQRVRVPYSKGFQFTVRPEHVTGKSVMDPARQSSEKRSALAKRMVEKARPASKNNRSANISIEGRQVK